MSFLPVESGVKAGARGRVETDLPGLFLCGDHVSPTGMLREIGIEAKYIADLICSKNPKLTLSQAWRMFTAINLEVVQGFNH